jgi:hypothetical protein
LIRESFTVIRKRRIEGRRGKQNQEFAEYEDVIIPGSPGTPTVVMKGWGALSAYGTLTDFGPSVVRAPAASI